MKGPTRAHELYTGAAGTAYHQGKRGIPPGSLPWVWRLRAARFQPHLSPTDRVLEFGVGAGWNLGGLNCAERVGHDVTNVLPPGPPFDGIRFEPDTAVLPNGYFQVILCHHALEHVDEPARVLVELRRLLAPGGRMLLAVPFECERRYRHFDPAEPNHHLYSWNVQSLGRLLQVCGWSFDSIGLARYGYERVAAVWSTRLHLGEPGFRWLRVLGQIVRPLREIVAVARG